MEATVISHPLFQKIEPRHPLQLPSTFCLFHLSHQHLHHDLVFDFSDL